MAVGGGWWVVGGGGAERWQNPKTTGALWAFAAKATPAFAADRCDTGADRTGHLAAKAWTRAQRPTSRAATGNAKYKLPTRARTTRSRLPGLACRLHWLPLRSTVNVMMGHTSSVTTRKARTLHKSCSAHASTSLQPFGPRPAESGPGPGPPMSSAAPQGLNQSQGSQIGSRSIGSGRHATRSEGPAQSWPTLRISSAV